MNMCGVRDSQQGFRKQLFRTCRLPSGTPPSNTPGGLWFIRRVKVRAASTCNMICPASRPHRHTHTHARTHVHTHTHAHAHAHAHAHTHTHTRTHTQGPQRAAHLLARLHLQPTPPRTLPHLPLATTNPQPHQQRFTTIPKRLGCRTQWGVLAEGHGDLLLGLRHRLSGHIPHR